jgi:hypothetical protein
MLSKQMTGIAIRRKAIITVAPHSRTRRETRQPGIVPVSQHEARVRSSQRFRLMSFLACCTVGIYLSEEAVDRVCGLGLDEGFVEWQAGTARLR